MLTPIAWFAFNGPDPIFLIDANTRVLVQNTVQIRSDPMGLETTEATDAKKIRHPVASCLHVTYCTNDQMGRVGLELLSSTTIPTNDLQNLHSDGAAKSGAVASEPALNGANSDVLAALVAVLTPEQRATLAKLLGG